MTAHHIVTAVVAVMSCFLSAGAASLSVGIGGDSHTPGSEAVVSVSLDVDDGDDIAALQLLIPGLGEVAEVVEGSAATCGAAADFSATAGLQADGTATLLLYSTAMASVGAGGEIASFRIVFLDSPKAVSLPVAVKASDSMGNSVACSASGSLDIVVSAPLAEYPAGVAYDYGHVPILSSYTLSIPVYNSGTTTLTIDGAVFSNPDMRLAGDLPVEVPAKATGYLTVDYSPKERGRVSSTMTLSGNSCRPMSTLRILADPFAVNEIHVGSVSGMSDEIVEIPVYMNNMDAVTGFTLEFDLPDQLEYVDGSFSLSDRATDHHLSVAAIGGKLHATAYSLSNSPFDGAEGTLATFAVKLNGKYGAYVVPRKAVLSSEIGGEIADVTSASYSGYVTISYPSISTSSALSFGRTPLTVATSQQLTVRNYGSAPLIIDRLECGDLTLTCDVDLPLTIEYGRRVSINVSIPEIGEGAFDSILRLYCNDPDHRMLNISLSGSKYAPNELFFDVPDDRIEAGQCALEVYVDNYDELCAMQFDIEAPEGWNLERVDFDGIYGNFSSEQRQLADATVRLFCFALDGSSIPVDGGHFMTLIYSYTDIEPDTYTFRVSNVKLSDARMTDRHSGYNYEQSFYYNVSTGLDAITPPDAPAEYYNLRGERISTPTPGIYIKRHGPTTTKVLIK